MPAMRFLSFAASAGDASSARGDVAPDAQGRRPQDQIPEVPPLSIRQPYLSLSRSYLRWCLGMLLWCILCVGYFVLTWQPWDLAIAASLCLLLLANVLFPATLFGGATWYKRLGWVTVLTVLFSAMFVYPLAVVGIGVYRRWQEGRYHGVPYPSDIWHAGLSLMTVLLALLTIRLAVRAMRLVRQLQRGEYHD
jgi:hypothetical protein